VQGRSILTCSWVVSGMPAGLIFREGKATEHIADANPLLPHIVYKTNSNYKLKLKSSIKQKALRDKIYSKSIVS